MGWIQAPRTPGMPTQRGTSPSPIITSVDGSIVLALLEGTLQLLMTLSRWQPGQQDWYRLGSPLHTQAQLLLSAGGSSWAVTTLANPDLRRQPLHSQAPRSANPPRRTCTCADAVNVAPAPSQASGCASAPWPARRWHGYPHRLGSRCASPWHPGAHGASDAPHGARRGRGAAGG